MQKAKIQELLAKAVEAREYSYSPYSNFKVGAALITKAGKIYTGCNVENASFGLTICAERTAIFKAISEGEREFEALAVVADVEGVVSPCGACRQIIHEFLRDAQIITGNIKGDYKIFTPDELLPFPFSESAFS